MSTTVNVNMFVMILSSLYRTNNSWSVNFCSHSISFGQIAA